MTLAGFTRVIAACLMLTFAFPALSAGDALTPEQKNAVEQVVKDYIDKNPEILLDAIRKLRDRDEKRARISAAEALVSLRPALENNPDSPVGGNPKGDVTVVEFFDYRCGFCKRVFPSIQALIKEDGNIRYVFKEWPILGPDSVYATEASLAGWHTDKSKYMAFHTAMMTSRGNLTKDKVLKFAAQVGYDVDVLQKAMSDPAIQTEIANNGKLTGALNFSGTPAFVIGNQLVPGAIDLKTLKKLVALARKGS